jgi:hypothetical protein
MALGPGKVQRSDIEILKMWLGLGNGNAVTVRHVPSGISVSSPPIALDDTDGLSRETARLMEELKRKLADIGYDVEAI